MAISYDNIKPGGAERAAQEERLAHSIALMDEADRMLARYIACTDEQRWAMLLYAMATHALEVFPAFGRMYWKGPAGSGKTTAMDITGVLCANPRDVTGTTPAVRSLLAEHALNPKMPMPVLIIDQVEKYYGDSGMKVGATIINDIMRQGYKSTAKMSWSANRVPVTFSIFCAVLMAGSGNLPLDIGQRTITNMMEKQTPPEYFDQRDAYPSVKKMGEALAAEVRRVSFSPDPQVPSPLELFDCTGLHPRLEGRVMEIWEPLFAVAWVLGGQKWLNRCLASFESLELSSTRTALTSRQQMLKYISELLGEGGPLHWTVAGGLLPGATLATALLATRDPEYSGRNQEGMEVYQGKTLDLPTVQVSGLKKRDPRYLRDRMRGYSPDVLLDAWKVARPVTSPDAQLQRQASPYDLTEEDDVVITERVARKPRLK